MDRAGFLKRAIGGAVALRYGQPGDVAADMEIPPQTFEDLWAQPVAARGMSMTASGGLCAPITPYYELLHDDGSRHWPDWRLTDDIVAHRFSSSE